MIFDAASRAGCGITMRRENPRSLSCALLRPSTDTAVVAGIAYRLSVSFRFGLRSLNTMRLVDPIAHDPQAEFVVGVRSAIQPVEVDPDLEQRAVVNKNDNGVI
jgi:hypothetical protein